MNELVEDLEDDSEVHTLREYPLETGHLKKGDCISVTEIERCTGVKRDEHPERYRLRALGLKHYVERRLLARGVNTRVRLLTTGIHILTSEECVAYLPKFFESKTHAAEKAYKDLTLIDRGELSATSQQSYDRYCLELGHRVQAGRRARKEAPKLTPVQRQTPSRLVK